MTVVLAFSIVMIDLMIEVSMTVDYSVAEVSMMVDYSVAAYSFSLSSSCKRKYIIKNKFYLYYNWEIRLEESAKCTISLGNCPDKVRCE